jgi:hypothetical protein
MHERGGITGHSVGVRHNEEVSPAPRRPTRVEVEQAPGQEWRFRVSLDPPEVVDGRLRADGADAGAAKLEALEVLRDFGPAILVGPWQADEPGRWTAAVGTGPEAVDWLFELVSAGLWAGVIGPEQLPPIGTDLLVHGVDSPAVRDLSGADIGAFDPHDTLECYHRVVAELGSSGPDEERRVGLALLLLASGVVLGGLSVREGVARAERLVVAAGYPDDADLMRLHSLEDEWAGAWGRTGPEIENEARAIFEVVTARLPMPWPVVIAGVIASG